jgi:hypothetical protein
MREYGCLETFRGEWVEETEGLVFDNELLGAGDIRVVTFLTDGERALTIVYGRGVAYIGCGSVCMKFD